MRRDRINSSIEQLKLLLEQEFARHQPNSKLEKADILEMAVSYLKHSKGEPRPPPRPAPRPPRAPPPAPSHRRPVSPQPSPPPPPPAPRACTRTTARATPGACRRLCSS